MEEATYVHTVPDHCDRIIWRNHYYGLPPSSLSTIKEMREALADAARALEGAWQMLDAINSCDPSRDRERARDKAWDGVSRARSVLSKYPEVTGG